MIGNQILHRRHILHFVSCSLSARWIINVWEGNLHSHRPVINTGKPKQRRKSLVASFCFCDIRWANTLHFRLTDIRRSGRHILTSYCSGRFGTSDGWWRMYKKVLKSVRRQRDGMLNGCSTTRMWGIWLSYSLISHQAGATSLALLDQTIVFIPTTTDLRKTLTASAKAPVFQGRWVSTPMREIRTRKEPMKLAMGTRGYEESIHGLLSYAFQFWVIGAPPLGEFYIRDK